MLRHEKLSDSIRFGTLRLTVPSFNKKNHTCKNILPLVQSTLKTWRKKQPHNCLLAKLHWSNLDFMSVF